MPYSCNSMGVKGMMRYCLLAMKPYCSIAGIVKQTTTKQTVPNGEEAAAKAMVAKKDLSPHSAAKTSANVEKNNPAAPEKGRIHLKWMMSCLTHISI